MAYTTIDKPDDYFNTVLYTGNGATLSITGVGFQPDWVWIKNRPDARDHQIYDSVRGVTKVIGSDRTSAEATVANGLTAFGSDGFTLGSDANVNDSGDSNVSWNWLAANGTVSNTAGSISSTVSANTTSGFSIVSYTGNGTSSATVGHGLGVAPKMTIIKQRNSSNGWNVWTFANNAGDPDSFGELNSTAAWYQDQGADGPYTTQPTSSLLTLTAYGQVNGNTNTYIAYCFAEVKGFSKFGSYTGNNSNDGPFLYMGFKPAFVLIKATNTTQWWTLLDNKRDTYNVATLGISPNSSNSESTFNTDRGPHNMDFVSNGLKIRTDNSGINGTNSFIYMAFAENPFVTSTSVPTTAR
jgi:hypothetical protein